MFSFYFTPVYSPFFYPIIANLVNLSSLYEVFIYFIKLLYSLTKRLFLRDDLDQEENEPQKLIKVSILFI